MKKPLFAAIGMMVVLALIGGIAFLQPSPLRSGARRAWKERNIADITARIADPTWITNEFARLQIQTTNVPSAEGEWLSEHIILTRKGEWLAYANSCQKQDGQFPDIFLARGSDGRWYYSTYHFCVYMVNLRMEDQPEDLATFVRDYFLQAFDGKSDDCLRKTWSLESK